MTNACRRKESAVKCRKEYEMSKVKAVKNVCYKGHEPKISCLMDPNMVEQGASKAKQLGLNALPISKVLADGVPYVGHNGQDNVGRWDEKIYAIPCPSCRVKSVNFSASRGNWLEYGNDRVTVWQAHFKRINVKVGQALDNNTVVGIEGSTGNVSGKHLHTSILIDGKRVDPYFYLTGELKLPPNKPATAPKDETVGADGHKNWANTDQWEKVVNPVRYKVETPGRVNLLIRRSPGTDKQQVGALSYGSVFYIDRLATLPDGQKWARIKDNPWNWVCLERGSVFAVEVKEWPAQLSKGYYFVRDSWKDTKSQTGAFSVLANAKNLAKKNGQKVFDSDGNEVI